MAAGRTGETGRDGAESAADKVEDEDEDPNELSASRGAVENIPPTDGPEALPSATDPFRAGKDDDSRGRARKSSNQLVLALGPGASAAWSSSGVTVPDDEDDDSGPSRGAPAGAEARALSSANVAGRRPPIASANGPLGRERGEPRGTDGPGGSKRDRSSQLQR